MNKDLKISLILLLIGLGFLTVFILYKVVSMSLDDGVYKPTSKPNPLLGGYVQYSKTNMDYSQLNEQDKMNFAYYIMKYNVHDKKELSESIYEVKSVKRPEDIFKIQSPSVALHRFASIATFLGFLLLIVIFIMWLVAIIFRVNPIKRSILFQAILTLGALVGLSYLFGWVEGRTVDKLDAIQSSL